MRSDVILKMMDKNEVAGILEEIGALLELEGENLFKSRAYANAAKIIRGLNEDLETCVRSGRLRHTRGIGDKLHNSISELVEKGRLAYYEELRAPYPPGFMEMMRVPGISPRKLKSLWDKLRIGSLAELEQACRENRLGALGGFGSKVQERILKGIEFYRNNRGRHRADFARRQAESVVHLLKLDNGISRISIAGSLRRGNEIIGNINIVAASDDPPGMLSRLAELPEADISIPTDLQVVSETEFSYALRHFTGSVEHNRAIQAHATRVGMRLDPTGLFRNGEPVVCVDEEAIFTALGLSYIPPELREDSGEIEAAAAGSLPRIVRREDIRGVLHVHSTWSDGQDTLEEMIRTAIDEGYGYIGISDHSRSASYANGLSEERIAAQREEIARLQAEYPQIRILSGIESDILIDGSLDYSSDILASFDFVVASVHSRFGMTEADMTARIVRALENPFITILGHPTGRLLLEREPYQVNIEKVVDAAIANAVALEINAHPQRLDLDWRFARCAGEKGSMFSIDPDAHNTRELSDISFGIGVARKAWLGPGQILNTREADDLLAFAKS